MTHLRIVSLTGALLVACSNPTPAGLPKAGTEEAKGATPPGPSADAKAANKAPAPAAHGDDTKMANPHGAPPVAAKPKGPPRDIKPSGTTRLEKAAELSYSVPSEWETQTVNSSMRVGQFSVPGPGGDGEMVVFRFPGGAGGIDANIARWKSQFKAPEGKTIDDIAKVANFEVAPLKFTVVDITGHYQAPERPGSTTMIDEPEYSMVAAIVEGSGDAFFFRLLGPAKTVGLWRESFEAGLRSAKAG